MKFFLISKKCFTFALAKQKRNVAQLVAHYVRDVGVGRSSRLIPTLRRVSHCITVAYVVFRQTAGTESGRRLLTYLFLLKGKDK